MMLMMSFLKTFDSIERLFRSNNSLRLVATDCISTSSCTLQELVRSWIVETDVLGFGATYRGNAIHIKTV